MTEGSFIRLRCEATADPSLELRYYWRKDGDVITYSNRIKWLMEANVLTINKVTIDNSGIYTCVAYTPRPNNSNDQASATVAVKGSCILI